MDSIKALRSFVRLAENLSFSQTAVDLSISQATVSKQISNLEKLLKTKLIIRSTRQMKLTEAGEKFRVESKAIVEHYERAIGEVKELKDKPSGIIRMSSTTLIGRKYIVPMLAEFNRHYPDISVHHYLGDSIADLILDGLDLTIRLGEMPDSTYRAQKIGSLTRVTVASKDFIKEHGKPLHPSDLKNLPCLISIGTSSVWRYVDKKGKPIEVNVTGTYRANTTEPLVAAALAGMGVFRGSTTAVDKELKSGSLIRLLEPYESPNVSMYAVTPAAKFLPERVRVLIEFIQKKCKVSPVFNAGFI